MTRRHHLLIMVGLFVIMGFAIYWILKPKEKLLTAETRVELIRDDVSEEGTAARQVVNNHLDLPEENVFGSKNEAATEPSAEGGKFFFINQCSDPLGVRMKEWQLFRPKERGYLKIPSDREYVTFTMVRIRKGEGEIVLEKKFRLFERLPPVVLTAREDEAGKVKLVSEMLLKSDAGGADR